MSERDPDSGRRRLLKMLAITPLALAGGARLIDPGALLAAAAAGAVDPTPECGDDDEPTPSETSGPFFKPSSPLRTSLVEPGMAGTRIVLAGRVFTRSCQPVPHALLDFWHADDSGEYDNAGFRLRGHQFTDAEGRYRLETIVPGLYPGRTRHFHVRVQASGGKILTTQLYFPDEPRNRRDFLYLPQLQMKIADGKAAKDARFHFLIDRA